MRRGGSRMLTGWLALVAAVFCAGCGASMQKAERIKANRTAQELRTIEVMAGGGLSWLCRPAWPGGRLGDREAARANAVAILTGSEMLNGSASSNCRVNAAQYLRLDGRPSDAVALLSAVDRLAAVARVYRFADFERLLYLAADIVSQWKGGEVGAVVKLLEEKVRPDGWPASTAPMLVTRGRSWALGGLAVVRRQHPSLVDPALGRLLEAFRCVDWQWQAQVEKVLDVYDPYEWLPGGVKDPAMMEVRCK